MRLSSTALFAVFADLLSCVDSASVSAASDTTTADLPAKLRVLPGFATNRLLRASETNDKNNEDRVMNAAIEKLTGEQPADEILKMLKLENGMTRALASPNLKLMKNYVQELNTINRNNKLSVIGIFTTHYGDDAVAKALVTMQSKVKTEEAANTIKQLRSDQLSAWLNSGKSVDDVFTLLKLHKNGHPALASPKMEVLDGYMKLVIRAQSS
ncbi:hypothetical protein JG687_00006658 [Phytophthora cactorum]|uniref:RxLR effector protein n=1 Tax=Phytophthora cactorum TaxID=29920 RepID=A0A329SVI2_9STRA|nr:hypothetical protein Pcac1_g4604 [Phytophthora cactorum]KAG2844646.1 hypothetical protein PC112_g2122 [Phytophthora cactorum]KAG2845320.1 hypothetical protein PC111_g1601 [Phytophthora cactorum]KAG2867031.1 hypothetical protein PC113_g2296 [Phytophthora cactorum]KAG2930547.1 hypothetical protein PC114_g2475 [Phytophthora cactorum]